VFGLLKTVDSSSPTVGPGTVATSFVSLSVLYAVLAAIEVRLLLVAIRSGAALPVPSAEAPAPSFAY
jgi:cytochrome d ubiquinol oxidase subunit I